MQNRLHIGLKIRPKYKYSPLCFAENINIGFTSKVDCNCGGETVCDKTGLVGEYKLGLK